ncbi:hypothetical protein LCGC14_0783510 [marine sediment metagenome]|uniref:Lipoprotein n=1 Tax=marine sediment metagenome TaxID=412755 RepID=A0A0F9T1U1_9ZZZZ
MKKTMIMLIFIILGVVGCDKRGTIEQEVERDSYIKDTFIVRTTLWVGTPIFNCRDIEEYLFQYNVPRCDVERTKESQYKKIYPVYLRLKTAIADKRIKTGTIQLEP